MTTQVSNQASDTSQANVIDLTHRYDEVERALSRVEQAQNHYDVLGVESEASYDRVKAGYENALALLHPSCYRVSVVFHDPTLSRFDRALERINYAFNVLSNESKRAEYDFYLAPKENALIVNAPRHSHKCVFPRPASKPSTSLLSKWGAFDSANQYDTDDEHFIEFSHDLAEENRRKFERVKLSIPAYVTGHDPNSGEWHEMTHTIDVSRLGALLYLRRRIRHRSLVHLALPLPMRLRCYRHSDPSYGVYSLVRRVEPPRDGMRVIAVEFVGEHPPENYIHKPWATYRTKWNGVDRRRAPRRDTSEVARIDYLSESFELVSQELATLENVSSSGIRLSVKTPPAGYDLVKVSLPAQDFEAHAMICNRFVGKDRLERLCLQFIQP